MSEHKPFVPPEANLKELSVSAVLMGAILGCIFAASSVYLGLKVGLTVSASIPVAVLSITLFRWLRLRGTILENNIAQTTGSAGESLAAGVAFTLPSLLLMGFDVELIRILLVALLGGLIGVLMMIPLRHGLIVKEHGKLSYPEGTACADVLVVGEKGGTEARMVFAGFFIGLFYAFFNLICKLWGEAAAQVVSFKTYLGGKTIEWRGNLECDVSPPMLGVGYIIGPKVAANMLAGGLLAYVVLMPLITMIGGEAVANMGPGEIRHDFILYIGAGAVAAGGFISLGRSIPTIISAFRRGLGNIGGTQDGKETKVLRTDQDLSMKFVLGGCVALTLAIFLAPVLDIDILTAILVVIFGFFFVTVSSRITGEIGSSSNPISGMTIATLLLTCGLFVLIGRTGVGYKAMALTTAALVCVAASNGGTISQDLKTGYLVGATPRLQQISIIIGILTSSLVIGFVLLLLLDSRETYQPVSYPGVTLTATGDRAEGPDKQTYDLAFVREVMTTNDGKELTRGKYMIDSAGSPKFFIDPAIDSAYPYRLEKASGHFGEGFQVAGDAPTELGSDHKPYRVVTLEKQSGDFSAGRYLVDDAGNPAYFAYPVQKLDAPKANLFALIIDGTLGGKLPWGLVLVGVLIAIILEMVGVASLSFAVGLYLPVATSAGIFVGGLVRLLVDRKRKKRGESEGEAEFSPGMLMASGLIAGGSIAGVIQSGLITAKIDKLFDISGWVPDSLAKYTTGNFTYWPMMFLLLMAGTLYWVGIGKKKIELPPARSK